MRARYIWLTLAIFTCSGPLEAETQLLRVPYRFLVIPPMEQGSKRVTKGSVAFEFPMRWKSGAILQATTQVQADGAPISLVQGQTLVRSDLRFDDASFVTASSFCVPRAADPRRKSGGAAFLSIMISPKLARSMTDDQMCLIDKDQDGQFDHSVMVNGGSPAARMPHTIAPVGYTVQAAAPVGEGDVMRVIYKVGLFRFDIMMMEDGKERQFSSFTYTDATGRHSFGSEVYGHKNPDGTYSFDVPGFSFLSSDHDPANKSVLVSWHATHQPAIVPIPDEIGYRMR